MNVMNIGCDGLSGRKVLTYWCTSIAGIVHPDILVAECSLSPLRYMSLEIQLDQSKDWKERSHLTQHHPPTLAQSALLSPHVNFHS